MAWSPTELLDRADAAEHFGRSEIGLPPKSAFF
jgi:hypothetical protein